MAAGNKNTKTSRVKRAGAVNIITGNTISRDASSGRFFVIKASDFEGVNVKYITQEQY